MNTIENIFNKDHQFWEKEKQTHVLKLFHDAATRVPAYKDFLKKNNVSAQSIQSFEDLQSVPPVSKKNYLTQYRLEELSWDNNMNKSLVFTSTSGSTGEPIYFHRSAKLDEQYAKILELFYKQNSSKKDSPTLVIICFGMGVWIGGLITYQAFYNLQQKGCPLSIITPGVNKKEIFHALKNLAPHYENIILTGYPPFVKDIIDEAPSQGISFAGKNIRILFAAESFTEEFRDYIKAASYIKCPLRDTLNIYGSADLGAMAFESPLAILIRRLCRGNKNLFKDFFGSINKTPTLAQYIPTFTSFESHDGNLLVTGNSTLPLIRYAIGDNGGVITFDEMLRHLSKNNIDLKEEMIRMGIEDFYFQLPFVYVYERNDFSTNLYGLQIYPEPIRQALIKNEATKYLTGKFVLETKFDEKQNQFVYINLEMKLNVSITEEKKNHILNEIVEELLNKNSEYRELYEAIKERALPKLVFHPSEDATFFKPGIKQQWVKK